MPYNLRIQLSHRSFMNMVIAAMLVVSLAGACITPTETLSPVPSQSVSPLPPATISPSPATVEPTSPAETPADTPQATALPVDPTPEGVVIGPDNLEYLKTVETFSATESGFMAWVGNEALALASEQKIEVFQVNPIQLSTDASSVEIPTVFAATGDGGLVAWGGFDSHQIYLLDVNTQAEAEVLATLDDTVTSLAFSPTGEVLASAGYDNVVRLYDTSTREEIDAWQFPSWITDLTFSPDGSQLAGVEAQEFTVHLWEVATGEELNRLMWADHAAPVLYGVTFSPDWQKVAWVARGTVLVMDIATGAVITTLGHEDFVNGLSWSPDGMLIATSAAATVGSEFSPVVILWDPVLGEKLDTLVTPTPAMRIAFSPDGTELATLHPAGVVQIWSIEP